jgi:hypothetical protein
MFRLAIATSAAMTTQIYCGRNCFPNSCSVAFRAALTHEGVIHCAARPFPDSERNDKTRIEECMAKYSP